MTDLGVRVLQDTEHENKKEVLIKGLKVVNQQLPGNIYIPFVNNSWRNYTVLNICENESKLFYTKTRAPYLLCLEIYRPEEILLTAQSNYSQPMRASSPPKINTVATTDVPQLRPHSRTNSARHTADAPSLDHYQ